MQSQCVDNTELKPPSKQSTSVVSCYQSAHALSSSLSNKPVVCVSKSLVISSSIVPDNKCSSQPASVTLTSSLSKPIIYASKSSVVSSSVVPDNKCSSQPASVTSFSASATFVASTNGLSNFPPDLQLLLPSDYSYYLEVYEDMPKGDFLGAPAECFRAKFYIKVER